MALLCSAKRTVVSRAYVNLRDPADVPLLAAALDGHAFVTERGAQHRCSVEYAPCQRVPPSRVKRDPREGTIEAGALHGCFSIVNYCERCKAALQCVQTLLALALPSMATTSCKHLFSALATNSLSAYE